MLSFNANAQHLFGNPSCADWLEWGAKEKLTWLNAYLVPLNLTNVARKKPSVDIFSQLPSLDPAVSYVGGFCDAHPDAFASVGAILVFWMSSPGNLAPSEFKVLGRAC